MNIQDLSLFTLITVGIVYVVDLIIRIIALFYVPHNRKPTSALSWLLVIYVLPVVGVPLFLLIGSTKLSRKRQREQHAINTLIKEYSRQRKEKEHHTPPEKHANHIALAESLTSLAASYSNNVTILTGYDELVHDIIKKVRTAKKHVAVEFYILALDATTEPFFEAMEQAVKRGVTVRVLFDAWGSRKFPRYKEMMQRLTDGGVLWYKMLPPQINPFSERGYNRFDLRNHRKIVAIDNEVAYIGSLNMIDKAYHRKDTISYIELVARLEGPSVLDAMIVFASDWYLESNERLDILINDTPQSPKGDSIVQIIPSGSSYPYRNNLKVFVSLIHSARTHITITNPYLVPDESLIEALISAAKRGVSVSILNSEAMDQWFVGHAQRSYYEELLKAGIIISLYKKPQLVHEKFFVIDDDISVIGSSNLDIRSFELNLECVAVVYDAPTNKTLTKHHHELRRHATTLTLRGWKKRAKKELFLDNIARLTSSLQ